MVPEYVTKPSIPQQKLAARLAAVPEITAIVGQGPHVIQPIRKVNGKVVVFSEGNLISTRAPMPASRSESQDGYVALLTLRIDGDGPGSAGCATSPPGSTTSTTRVLPVGPALSAGEGDPAACGPRTTARSRSSGREPATPEPEKLP